MKKHIKLLAGTALAFSLWSVGAQAQETAEVRFPELKSTYLKTGDFVNLENLKKIAAGLHKDQVRRLLGNPHFSEGIGGPHTWNYAFNFYTGAMGGDYVTCQYQIHYDKDYRIDATYWKDQQCENFLMEKKAAPLDLGRPISLSADGLFAFGRSGLNDLQPAGRQSLSNLAQQINSGYQISSLRIVGHTDRIGSVAQNMELSRARAETVKAYLVNNGVPASVITTSGVASSQPVVNCPGPKSPAVVACLQPNRRVELTITGTAK